MKRIIITGASGLVASKLIELLQAAGGYELYLLTRNSQALKQVYLHDEAITCYTLAEFEQYATTSKLSFDCLIHLAFSRSVDGAQLAESLDYTARLLSLAQKIDLKIFANISSQMIYGTALPVPWTEATVPKPKSMYALAKYSTELMTKAALSNTAIRYTSIRLSSVMSKERFVHTFVENALGNETIKITTPRQSCSFISCQDAALALMTLIRISPQQKLEDCYNLGTGLCYSILNIAEMVQEIAVNQYQLQVALRIEKDELNAKLGMDSSLFMSDFNWQAQITMPEMISSLFKQAAKTP